MTEEIRRKILSYIGFARKSGGAAFGTDAVLAEVRRSGAAGRICVVASSDASDRTLKQIRDKCSHYGVKLVEPGLTGDGIADAAGKRMTVSAVAITDKNLASAVAAAAEHSGGKDNNGPGMRDEQLEERNFPHESGK